jgi:hypothetical protein
MPNEIRKHPDLGQKGRAAQMDYRGNVIAALIGVVAGVLAGVCGAAVAGHYQLEGLRN